MANPQPPFAENPPGNSGAPRTTLLTCPLPPFKLTANCRPKNMNTALLRTTPNGGPPAIALANLKKHLRTLITLEATDDLVISCYLNLEGGKWEEGAAEARNVFRERRALLRKSLIGERKNSFEEALHEIEVYMEKQLSPRSHGIALFARGGERPFFLPLQFQVPLPNWITVDAIPNVYHLVELKDTYHRFVLLLMTGKGARILEINLGAVTEEVWTEQPQLRDRIGSGWTKTHYQHHREQQTERFIAEKIQVLDRLTSAGGHTHLILAGNPDLTARMKKALPKHLAEKLVDTVHASERDTLLDIVTATNSLFAEHEEAESLDRVHQLQREIRTHGLAVAGAAACLRVLKEGQADVLILAKAYKSDPGWACRRCGEIRTAPAKPMACMACLGFELHEVDLQEEMVRRAERNRVEVEIVNQSDLLMELGGVGCLLRYQSQDRVGR